IEIAGEGELRDILVNQDIREERRLIQPSDEANSVEEAKQSDETPSEEGITESIPEEPKEPTPAPTPTKEKEDLQPSQENQASQEKQEEVVDEEKPVKQIDAVGDQELSETDAEESTPREELGSRDEKNPIPEVKKKPRKRDRKIIMETIKSAEKKKIREKNRKKMLEIAEKAISKRNKNKAFDQMLNGSINDLKRTAGKGTKGSGAGSFGLGNSLTDADAEAVSSQIYPHWGVPSGVRDAENIIIEMRIELRENGEVISSSVKILDEKRYATDYIFRAAADSARRAVLEASPLKISKNKIELFRNFVLRFNVKEALKRHDG
ncbi:MAG: hypothetical protein LBO02_01745, partial [Holosporaceae bacterium]|nr:hypothetical protein [Holosporaceae bacterium]